MDKPDNPQAYPCLDSSYGELSMRDPGMTLRDYFAGQALAMSQHDAPAALANWAYRVADAMLEERQRT